MVVGYEWWQCWRKSGNGGGSDGVSDNGMKVVVGPMMIVKGGDGSIDSGGSWKHLTY